MVYNTQCMTFSHALSVKDAQSVNNDPVLLISRFG